MQFNKYNRNRTVKLELFLEGSNEAALMEEWQVENLFDAWRQVEAMTLKTPHPHGFIRVTEDNGDIIIVAGLLVVLQTITRHGNDWSSQSELRSETGKAPVALNQSLDSPHQ